MHPVMARAGVVAETENYYPLCQLLPAHYWPWRVSIVADV